METFAQIDANGVVVNITIGHAPILAGCSEVEYWADGSQRKYPASIGGTYDAVLDVFIDRQPYPSWVLDENLKWQAPVPYPNDGKTYVWDEATTSWFEVPLMPDDGKMYRWDEASLSWVDVTPIAIAS